MPANWRSGSARARAGQRAGADAVRARVRTARRDGPRAGAIVTREELYAEVWGGELRAGDRSVDVYVSKLRGKLETAMPDRRFIHTHPGFGYRFQPQPAREQRADIGGRRACRGFRLTDEPRRAFTKCSHRHVGD